MGTEPATLAGDGVDRKILDGVKAAQVLAKETLRAPFPVDVGDLPAPELGFLLDGRTQQQMEVGGINITVGKHLALGQGGQRADDAGLAGTPLTA
jgi:hypothetical protein